MRNVYQRESGHTLIELIIVLTIFSVTLTIPAVTLSSLQEKHSVQFFLDMLKEDLRFAQQYAYANERYVAVQYFGGHYYVRDMSTTDILKKRSVPPAISFQPYTMDINEVAFNGKGNIRKAGTFFINTPAKDYRLVYLIGKGRFYIEEKG